MVGHIASSCFPEDSPRTLSPPRCASFVLCLKKDRLYWICLAYYAVLLFMMLHVSSVAWDFLPFVKIVQFPWRLLGVTAVCQLVLISHLFTWFSAHRSSIQCVTLLFLFTASVLWYWPMFFPAPYQHADAERMVSHHQNDWFRTMSSYSSTDEFTPITATEMYNSRPVFNDPIIECSPRAANIVVSDSRYFIRAEVTVDSSTVVKINQIYFPNWNVEIDGSQISQHVLRSNLTQDGRIQFVLDEPGEHIIHAHFSSPPGQSMGVAFGVCFGAALLLIVVVVGAKNTEQRQIASGAGAKTSNSSKSLP